MSELIAIVYEDESTAQEVKRRLLMMEREYLVDVADAVVATRADDGKVKLDQLYNLTTTGAISGAWWGLIAGLLLSIPFTLGAGGLPLWGALIGAGAGALGGKVSDYGIDDDFIRACGETIKPGCSALFVLVRKLTPDRVLAAVKPYGGRVLRTSLSSDAEARLETALSKARQGRDTHESHDIADGVQPRDLTCLNRLLGEELASMELYDRYIDDFDSPEARQHLGRVRGSHADRAAVLRAEIRGLGGSVSVDIENLDSARVPSPSTPRDAIDALAAREESSSSRYEQEMNKLSKSVQQFLAGEILPEHKRAHRELEALRIGF